jgi:hypothetical protein
MGDVTLASIEQDMRERGVFCRAGSGSKHCWSTYYKQQEVEIPFPPAGIVYQH